MNLIPALFLILMLPFIVNSYYFYPFYGYYYPVYPVYFSFGFYSPIMSTGFQRGAEIGAAIGGLIGSFTGK
ncbi:unnamed protein product [Brugia timori]|uniref:Uncharacterized protein n=1 Tax=Brugia timori TaxID=42155 RepID=A0A0R3QQR2_9BILA|nr:unnamed protein product [Brugia timori]